MIESETLANIIREAKIILADAEAKDVDKLTLGCAERLLSAVKDIVSLNDTFFAGHSMKQRKFHDMAAEIEGHAKR